MALFNTKDFVVKAGLAVGSTTAAVSTNSGVLTGAFTVGGGVAIGKNLVVVSTATVYGPTELKGQLSVVGASTLTDTLYVGGAITANSTLDVTGATTLRNTLTVTGTNATLLGGTLAVIGATTLTDTLTANGNATFNANLEVTGSHTLTVGTGTTTLGGLLDVTGIAHFKDTTAATTGAVGSIKVDGGAYVAKNLVLGSTATSTASAADNSIYTPGGIGIAGDLKVGGNTVIAGNLTVTGAQTIVDSTTTRLVDPVIEIGAGADSQALTGPDAYNKGLALHYWTGSADTSMFVGRRNSDGHFVIKSNVPDTGATPLLGDYSTVDLGILIVHDTTDTSSGTTGALQVAGGVGIEKKLYVGTGISAQDVTVRSLDSITGAIVYVDADGKLVTDADLTYDGTKLTGTITQADYATDITGGTAGALVYQSASSSTEFLAIGTSTWFLASNGTAPIWKNPADMEVGLATTATNIAGGSAGSLPYQSAAGITTYLSGGSQGYILRYNSTSHAPEWFDSSVTGFEAYTSKNISGGTANQIPFQSGSTATTFSANLTFDSGTNVLSATNVTASGTVQGAHLKDTSLTSGRVILATTDGQLSDSSNLTFNGTSLSLGGSGGNITMTGGDISGVANVTASAKVQAATVRVTSLSTYSGKIAIIGTDGEITVDTNLGFSAGKLTVSALEVVNNAALNTVNISGATSSTSTLWVGGAITGNSTLDIAGATTLSSTLNVTSSTTLSHTLNVTGSTTLSSTLAVNGTGSSTSTVAGNALQVAGGVGISKNLYVDEDAYINADLYVEGTIYVKGASLDGVDKITGSTGTFAFANITGAGTALTVDNAASIGGKLTLNGSGTGLEVTNNALVKGTLTSESDFKVGTSTGKFTVAAASGNTLVKGTLEVQGYSTLAGMTATTGNFSSTLNVDGATTLGSTLGVTGASTLTSTLYVGGAITGNSTLDITGATTLRNTLTVTGTNATLLGGTLDVVGATTLNSTLNVTGATSATSTLYVGGAVTAGSTLEVNGTTTLKDNLTVSAGKSSTLGGTLEVTGTTTLKDNLTVQTGKTTTLGGTLTVTGTNATLLGGSLTVIGATTVGDLSAGATTATTLNVTSTATFATALTVGTPTDGTPIAALYSNNTVLASYTSPAIAPAAGKTALDVWAKTAYRTARYTVQVLCGTSVHITEITLFHNNVDVYMNEYGISTSAGELGEFDADIVGSDVTLQFTPKNTNAASCVVKVIRMAITA